VNLPLQHKLAEPDCGSPHAASLRLLSYNVQAGVGTRRYRHYVTHSWRHVLPFPQRMDTLGAIARQLHEFDVVALQEVDAGSLRSEYVNLTEFLAHEAGFPHWFDRTNRRLGQIARHAIGLLSRIAPAQVSEAALPGGLPGRGSLFVRFGHGDESVVLAIVHLALGRRARERQFDFLAERLASESHTILMGDLNCRRDSAELTRFVARAGLVAPLDGLCTYPSWRPQHGLDHILTSPTIGVTRARVLDLPYSDHLPVAVDVALPIALPHGPFHAPVAGLSRIHAQAV